MMIIDYLIVSLAVAGLMVLCLKGIKKLPERT